MPRKKSDSNSSKESPRPKSKTSAERKTSRPRSRKATTSKQTLSTKEILHTETPHITHEELYGRIAKRAYELYEQRGRHHGQDVEHWVEAETEVKEDLKMVRS